MHNKRSTKRALLLSALSLLMCVSMLVGSTFAWFTDSVTSGKNKIVAGNLDIELEYKKVVDGVIATDWTSVQGATAIFNPDALWEPGRVEVVYLKVSNLGSLALKYQLGVNVYNETPGVNVAGDEFKLSDYLVFKTVEMPDALTTYTDREAAALAAGTEIGLKDYNGTTKALEAKSDDVTVNDEDYVALIIYMPETVGNEANYRGNAIPTIELGINLFATQYTSEKDSFDENYDKEAVVTVKSPSITLPNAQTPAEDKILETPAEKNVEVTLPAEFLSDLANAPDAPGKVALSHAEPKISTTANTIYFEHIELIDENGEIIDLEAMGNDVPVTVKFNVGDAFNAGETVIVYHDGEIFATPVVDADKNVTYTATHFCEVFVGYNDGKIDTAKEFETTVAAVEDGDIITLAGDIVFNKDVRTDSGGGWYEGLNYEGDKSFTIDLNGYTITNEAGSLNDRLLRIANNGTKANTITIKNGTLIGASGVYSVIATGGTNAQKITINLENVKATLNNSNGSGAALLVRGGAELNAKAGSVITAENGYCAIECATKATVNIYDGVEIYQNGTSSYCGSLVGVSGNGTINVYGGYGKGVKGGFIVMTSGGTINISGGEWIAKTNGAYANGNDSVLIAQNDKKTYPSANPSIINVTGGTFKGGYNCYSYTVAADAQINISGGNFNADPTRYLVGDCKAAESNGIWAVGTTVVTTVDELKAAFNNAKAGDVVLITKDITITDKWDNRYGGRTDKAITINGMGNTLKFTGEVSDGFNYHSVFRFNGAATVQNLTFDLSEVAGTGTWLRAISAASDLVVDNCVFIGSDNYPKDNAIVIGDSNASAQINASASITNCVFTNWRRGVSDNENAKELKSFVISGNTFTNAEVNVSAYESMTFTNNKMTGNRVSLTSYTNAANAKVTATGNELDAAYASQNVVGSNSKRFTAANVTAQTEITVYAQ